MDWFNRKYNPGDPLSFDPDFTKDIKDREHSGEYDDAPPPPDESDT